MKFTTLVRRYLHDRTIGELEGLATLERVWNGNKVNVSCIPEGTYLVSRDVHGRYQYYRINNVPKRSDIEIHGGTIPFHSEGCILVGTHFTREYDLRGSEEALEKLLNLFGEDDFILTIRQFNPLIDQP